MGNFLYVIKDEQKPLYKNGSIIPIKGSNKKKKDYKPKVNYVKYNYYSKKKIYNNNNNDKTKNKR